jgi:divalent metal cation (Fe/Co/Zn/Cd) transporter
VVAYVVLGLAGLAEGTSFAPAFWQVRGEAKRDRTSVGEHVKTSQDTTVKTALFEDAVAIVGLALAAAGIALRQLTGSGVWDGAASIAIGALLIFVAIRLGTDSRDLLIGRAAGPRELERITAEIQTAPGVDELLELLTMYLGPDHLIVAARVWLADDIAADDIEDLADRIDRKLAEVLPQTPHVFIDPTQNSRPARQPTSPEPA